MPELSPNDLAMLLLWYLAFLFSTTAHEAAHALVAWLGGDPTAYYGGQVSLSPLPHIRREPVGTVLVPLASFLLFGWTVGWASAPYDPFWAQRHPRRAALMAAAGPAANLLLAVIALVIGKALLASGALAPPELLTRWDELLVVANGDTDSMLMPLGQLLSILLTLNLLLFLFNLFPVPPLDGSGVLEGLLPERLAERYSTFIDEYGLRFVGLLLAWWAIGYVFTPAMSVALLILYW